MQNNYRPIITDNKKLREDVPEVNEYFERAKEEVDNIPKENNIVVDKEYITNINCPVCDSESYRQLLVKRGFIYVVCDKCSHVYVRNRLRTDVLLDLYKQSEVDALDRKTHQSAKHIEYWSKVHRKYVDILLSYNLSNNNLLDIGSGDGRFLNFCKINTSMCLYANDYCSDNYNEIVDLIGKDNYYYAQKIEDIEFEEKKFGIITLWGVLEHLPNPKQVLQKCCQIMDDDGRLLALIPNIYSRAFKILGVNVPTLNPRQHINFFTEKSMEYICDEAGMKIIDEYQELPVIDLMYPYIDYSESLIDEIIESKESYYKVFILGKA